MKRAASAVGAIFPHSLHDCRTIPTFVAGISQTTEDTGVTFLANEWTSAS